MKKKFTDSVRVNDPCTESWDEMFGNDRVRFCSHCAKNVNNLSTMTLKEARKLVRRSGGSLCIRYIEHPETKAPLFADTLTQITRRRVPLMAAGVMTASLSLSTLAYAQGGAIPPPSAGRAAECEDNLQNRRADQSGGAGSIKGTVVDQNGAVVAGIPVSLIDGEGKVLRQMISDASGEFRFEGLLQSAYSIRAERSAAFASRLLENVSVGDIEISVQIELEAAVETMIMSGIAISLPALKGVIALAVSNDELEETRELLARGEDVNKREDDGSTPLFTAVEDGNLELVKLLLEFGAKVNIRNDEGETPLMMIEEDASLELVELLLLHGAKVNRVAKNGDTALIRAADEAKPEILQALIRAGAELDHQNDEGLTALMSAADSENFEKVRMLVEAGADVNRRDSDGDNAWDHTTEKEIEDYLVAHGVVLDPEDMDESP